MLRWPAQHTRGVVQDVDVVQGCHSTAHSSAQLLCAEACYVCLLMPISYTWV